MESKKHIPNGYILLSRNLIESEIWSMPPLYIKVWLYILTKAQHKDIKGFKRGETMVSIPELQKACKYKVAYRTEIPTKHQIDNVLRWLRKTHGDTHDGTANTPMITTTKTTRGLRVKVCNYNVYQDPKNYEYDSVHDNENDNGTTTVRRPPDTIDKNVKNDKNDKNIKEKKEETSLDDLQKVADYYQSVISPLGPNDFNELKQDCDQYGKDIVCKAIQEAGKRGAKDFNKPYAYITKCLVDWNKKGLTSKEAIDQYLNTRPGKKTSEQESQRDKPLTPREIYDAWI